MDIPLGSKVRDRITGFTGIAVSKHTYMNGCVRFSVAPPVGADNKLQDNQVFDIQQLEVLDQPEYVPLRPELADRPGGDRPLNAPHR